MTATTTHACPAPECQLDVPQDKLACPTHWYRLPAGLRAEINRAWRCRDYRKHRKAVAGAVAFWRGE